MIQATINDTDYEISSVKGTDASGNTVEIPLKETGVIDTPKETLTPDTITANGTVSFDVTNYKVITITTQVSGGATKTLDSISATYSGGSVVVGTSLDDLTDIVVTAHYTDSETFPDEEVTGYTLSGEISAVGDNTITVTYQSKTAQFVVEGTAEPVTTSHNILNPALVLQNKYLSFDASVTTDTETSRGAVVSDKDGEFIIIIPYTPAHIFTGRRSDDSGYGNSSFDAKVAVNSGLFKLKSGASINSATFPDDYIVVVDRGSVTSPNTYIFSNNTERYLCGTDSTIAADVMAITILSSVSSPDFSKLMIYDLTECGELTEFEAYS